VSECRLTLKLAPVGVRGSPSHSAVFPLLQSFTVPLAAFSLIHAFTESSHPRLGLNGSEFDFRILCKLLVENRRFRPGGTPIAGRSLKMHRMR
jgi:hypothetical protein